MASVVTAEEMRDLDRKAGQEWGMPSATLMENAGWAVYKVAKQMLGGSVKGKKIAVLCGTGNNGGDGFVAARLLFLRGAIVSVFLSGKAEKLRGDAKIYYSLLAGMSGVELLEAEFDFQETQRTLHEADLLIDALLGTGLTEAPRSEMAALIREINGVRAAVLSVDIPSGVNATTGEVPGVAVHADETVTFAFPKWGQFLPPGDEHVGKLHLYDIGFDWGIFAPSLKTKLSEAHDFDFLQKRAQESNKGDYGHVYIVGGSAGMAGAPALVARAAQRSGAGLVTVLAPACVRPTVGAKLDEQMTISLPDRDGAVSETAFDAIREAVQKAEVLCLGPGMTTKPGAAALVHRIIAELELPLIVDADALNALALHPEAALQRKGDAAAPLILTPHPGEAARLLGSATKAVQSDRKGSVQALAQKYRAIVVLKGRYTLIADEKGEICLNPTGNPGMATGGSGDTLTGILGGLIGQWAARNSRETSSVSALQMAALAVWLHGQAGDLAAAELGEASLVAGDLTAFLPKAFQSLPTDTPRKTPIKTQNDESKSRSSKIAYLNG